jgi:hypothetical protein
VSRGVDGSGAARACVAGSDIRARRALSKGQLCEGPFSNFPDLRSRFPSFLGLRGPR